MKTYELIAALADIKGKLIGLNNQTKQLNSDELPSEFSALAYRYHDLKTLHFKVIQNSKILMNLCDGVERNALNSNHFLYWQHVEMLAAGDNYCAA